MKILAISEAGYSCDLLYRMKKEGHDIRLWIKEDKWKHVYDDMLFKVSTWKPSVEWSDFVFFDHSGMSDIWKQINGQKPCFGGSEFADKLEKDRPFAKDLFKKIGLKDFEHIKVNTIKEAIEHVRKHKIKHVVKPVGKDVDSHHVIISESDSGEDAAELLSVFEDQGLKPDYLEVEERKIGIEVGVSGWYISDGKEKGKWSGDININFEHKRLAAGYPEGVGPLTGEMGTAMVYQDQRNPFFLRTLNKIAPILSSFNYRGQIDISFIITRDGEAYPLEATPRLGYPACMIEEPLQISSFAELFYNTACGNSAFVNHVKRDWAVGVVCILPGYPSNEEVEKRSVGIPIFGITKETESQLHLVEVKAGKTLSGTRIVTSSGMGYPMVITGTGKTLPEAKSNAYRVISNSNTKRVRIPNMQYRHDIGDRVMRQMSDLYRLGIVQPPLQEQMVTQPDVLSLIV